MTVAALSSSIEYLEDGVTLAFPVPFRFLANSITASRVLTDGTVVALAAGTDFTVTGGSTDSGGTLTLGSSVNGATLRIKRVTPRAQATDYIANDSFPAESHELALDRSILIDQEQDDRIDDTAQRALMVPDGEVAGALPAAAQLANKYFAFGPDGKTVVPSAGTGADAGLRADLGQTTGASIVNWIRTATGAVARTVADWFEDEPSVMDYIPAAERVKIRLGTSTADLASYFAAADAAGKPFKVPAGTYKLATDVTLTQRVEFKSGALLVRDGGAIGFSGGITAPIEQIFSGFTSKAQIDINNIATPIGWPDWFGTDADALELAVDIFQTIHLSPRTYTTTRTVVWDYSNKNIIGMKGSATGLGGTVIYLTGAAAAAGDPVIQAGTLSTAPGDIPANVSRLQNISGIATNRAGACATAASGKRVDAAPGWLIAGNYECLWDRLFDYNSPTGFRLYGNVGCDMSNCSGVRVDAGTGGFTDFTTTFLVGGYSTSFGFVGANASLRLKNCGSQGGVGAQRAGLVLFGYIADTWIDGFEMSQFENGIVIDGADAAGTTLTAASAHQDVVIKGLVLDACVGSCLKISNLNSGGCIQIDNPYGAVNGAYYGIEVNNSEASIIVKSGQFASPLAVASFGAVIGGTSSRVRLDGTVFQNFNRPVHADGAITACHFDVTATRTAAGTDYAAYFSGLTRSFVDVTVDGVADSFSHGIWLNGTGCTYNEINLTKQNYNAITTAAAARKLFYNSATWGGGSTVGTGNVVTGVLG